MKPVVGALEATDASEEIGAGKVAPPGTEVEPGRVFGRGAGSELGTALDSTYSRFEGFVSRGNSAMPPK